MYIFIDIYRYIYIHIYIHIIYICRCVSSSRQSNDGPAASAGKPTQAAAAGRDAAGRDAAGRDAAASSEEEEGLICDLCGWFLDFDGLKWQEKRQLKVEMKSALPTTGQTTLGTIKQRHEGLIFYLRTEHTQ